MRAAKQEKRQKAEKESRTKPEEGTGPATKGKDKENVEKSENFNQMSRTKLGILNFLVLFFIHFWQLDNDNESVVEKIPVSMDDMTVDSKIKKDLT